MNDHFILGVPLAFLVESIVNKQSRVRMLPLLYSHSGSKTPLQSFLGIAEQHTAQNGVRVSTAPVHLTHTSCSLL